MRELVSNSWSHISEIYSKVSIFSLRKLLLETNSPLQQTSSIQAIMTIFKSLGIRKYIPHLSVVVPLFTKVLNYCQSKIKSLIFQQLGVLVTDTKQFIRPYLPKIIKKIHKFWSNTESLPQTLDLIGDLSNSLGEEFSEELTEKFIPKMIQLLESEKASVSIKIKVLTIFQALGNNLQKSSHVVFYGGLLKLMNDSEDTLANSALETLSTLSKTLDITPYTSPVVHFLVKTLKRAPLFDSSMKLLCNLVKCSCVSFLNYVSVIEDLLSNDTTSETLKSLNQDTVNELKQKYYNLLNKIKNVKSFQEKQMLQLEFDKEKNNFHSMTNENFIISSNNISPQVKTTQQVNIRNLSRSWDTSQCVSSRDWSEWFRGFSVSLLAESPSPALRSCHNVAQVYSPLAMNLFNYAFVSCWRELEGSGREQLVQNLVLAIKSTSIPPDLLQTILDLCEFMEFDDSSLPISKKILGEAANNSQAYAKALRYKELQFLKNPSPNDIEELISLYSQLGLLDSANGLLKIKNEKLDESWFEKLGRWEEALSIYQKKLSQNPLNTELSLGKLRCLKALGKWEEISGICDNLSKTVVLEENSEEIKKSLVSFKVRSAYHTRDWNSFKSIVKEIDKTSEDSFFFQAVLSVIENEHEKASILINQGRSKTDLSFSALIAESYSRAYDEAIRLQLFSELEEIIEYKKSPSEENKRHLLNTWNDRLKGCQKSSNTFSKILGIRSILFSPVENIDGWAKFCNFASKNGELELSRNILTNIIGKKIDDNDEKLLELTLNPKEPPKVVFLAMKYLWQSKKNKRSIISLTKYCNNLSSLVSESNKYDSILSKMYLKITEWRRILLPDDLSKIFESCELALKYNKYSYKTWHLWALVNFDATRKSTTGENYSFGVSTQDTKILPFVETAVEAFFRSISLCERSKSFRDKLRLLNLWFNYGSSERIEKALRRGFELISIDTWIQVIPQIVARIDSIDNNIRSLVQFLLCKIGLEHPQALIYPLTVATKSFSERRKKAAEFVLDEMRKNTGVLIEQALMFGREMIKTAVSLQERWYETLEDAAECFYTHEDIPGMLKKLEPLHMELEDKSCENRFMIAFLEDYGRDVQRAWECCKNYKINKNPKEIKTGISNSIFCFVFFF